MHQEFYCKYFSSIVIHVYIHIVYVPPGIYTHVMHCEGLSERPTRNAQKEKVIS